MPDPSHLSFWPFVLILGYPVLAHPDRIRDLSANHLLSMDVFRDTANNKTYEEIKR